ncbi:hypothetical protein HYFRA_00005855 [Hymenoscyphus fraxineus]|uniref:Phosphoglycerate mutase-like protein n=1 Tax=Hymenoscyphus fraxineus TaxID=746836 RepID=A0A9N9KU02_9HELO|nr:hypothetical protein HYFRA_00005855 [Hymenoscyphus fraxineus]
MFVSSTRTVEKWRLRSTIKRDKNTRGYFPGTTILFFLAKNHDTTIPAALQFILKQVNAETIVDDVKADGKVKESEKKLYTGEEAILYFQENVLKSAVEEAVEGSPPKVTRTVVPMWVLDDDEFCFLRKEAEKTAPWVAKVLFEKQVIPPPPHSAARKYFFKDLKKDTGAVGLYIPPTPPRTLIPALPAGEEPKALHNVLHYTNKSLVGTLHDPALTPTGLLQCLHASHKFPYLHHIDYIFASPMRRTLQTALATFMPILSPEKKIVAWTEIREFGNGRPNTGHKLNELKEVYDSKRVDFRLVPEGWEYNSENDGVTCPCCRNSRPERVRPALQILRRVVLDGGEWKGMPFRKATRDVHIAFVTHGAFLASLLRQTKQFNNTDINSGYFKNGRWVSIGWYKRA